MARRPLLSIIVPAFNERATLPGVLKRLAALPVDKEVIVVDDGSSDAGFAGLPPSTPRVRILRHHTNLGKGAAIRTALAHVHGEWAVVQDADDEIDPMDIVRLLRAARRERAVAAFGSRFLGGPGALWRARAKIHPGLHVTRAAGRLITAWTNILYRTKYTDVTCVYKLIPSDLLRRAHITSRGFDIEAELAAKLAPFRRRIIERRIRYAPRVYKEGKKIRPWDTVRILWTLTRLRFARPLRP